MTLNDYIHQLQVKGIIADTNSLFLKYTNLRGGSIYYNHESQPSIVIKVFDKRLNPYFRKEIYIWGNILSDPALHLSPQFISSENITHCNYACLIYQYEQKYLNEFKSNENDIDLSFGQWIILVDKLLLMDKHFLENRKIKKLVLSQVITKDISCSIPYSQEYIVRYLKSNEQYIKRVHVAFNENAFMNNVYSLFKKVYLLPIGLIHGDASLRNIVINKNGLGYIDWEFSGINSPIAEYCQSVNHFIGMDPILRKDLEKYFVERYNELFNENMDLIILHEYIYITKLIYIIQKSKEFVYLANKDELNAEEQTFFSYLKNVIKSLGLDDWRKGILNHYSFPHFA